MTMDIWAASGYWQDILDAINQAQPGDNVRIPTGTFDFIDVGESWTGARFVTPAGVNLFGAPTERTSGLPYDGVGQNPNNQVIVWKTVLTIPWDVPNVAGQQPEWFRLVGNSDPNKPSRISDVKLVGYRSINPESVNGQTGIRVENVVDFRVDHVCLEHTCAQGIGVWGLKSRGVIDHNRIYNIYGYDDLANYMNSTVGYGISPSRDWSSTGYDPTMEVLGKYKDYTVFIEDNYFSKWRHIVSSGHGAHYVFRYNTIDLDWGHFSLDAHGLRDTGVNRWGARATEIYENKLINAGPDWDFRSLLQNGGGSGVWFNNYVDTSYRSNGIALYPEDYVASEIWHLKDFYLWSKRGPWVSSWDGVPSGFTPGRNVLADWDRPAYDRTNLLYPNVDPAWSIAGYKPYPYPHPLAIDFINPRRISGIVRDVQTNQPLEGARIEANG